MNEIETASFRTKNIEENEQPFDQIVGRIDTQGYCVIPKLYDEEQVNRLRDLANYWHDKSKSTLAENRPRLANDDYFVWNPQAKDHYFLEMMFGPPVIERVLMHFLNDEWFKQIPPDRPNYILRNLLLRSSHLPLPMHIDSLVPYGGDFVFVMQVSVVLEDQNPENGCTVVVPGSHKSGGFVEQSAFDSATPLETRAGDVVIWDSRIWHGAGENRSAGTRWAMIGTFSRWWLKQMFRVTDNIPQEIYEKLTDSQKAVMGFCSLPHFDETRGIDMKCGYESLLPNVADYQ